MSKGKWAASLEKVSSFEIKIQITNRLEAKLESRLPTKALARGLGNSITLY